MIEKETPLGIVISTIAAVLDIRSGLVAVRIVISYRSPGIKFPNAKLFASIFIWKSYINIYLSFFMQLLECIGGSKKLFWWEKN